MIKDTRVELVKGTGPLNVARYMPTLCRLDLIALDGSNSLEMSFITEPRNGKKYTDHGHVSALHVICSPGIRNPSFPFSSQLSPHLIRKLTYCSFTRLRHFFFNIWWWGDARTLNFTCIQVIHKAANGSFLGQGKWPLLCPLSALFLLCFFRPRLYGENLSRVKGSPSHSRYPGRANISYTTNRLHEKVGSARRTPRPVVSPS